MAKQQPTNEPDPMAQPTPGTEAVPQEKIEQTPTNPRKSTEEAAIKSAETSAKRQYTTSVEKGADKDFNTFVRRAHEDGNPEQLSPMQIEQNARDKAHDEPKVASQHDLDHEDTKWVVKNVLQEPLPADA